MNLFFADPAKISVASRKPAMPGDDWADLDWKPLKPIVPLEENHLFFLAKAKANKDWEESDSDGPCP